MVEYSKISCKLTNIQLNKLKKAVKSNEGTKVIIMCENHGYCKLEMPEKGDNILEYKPGEKSVMTLFVIYADLESLLEKITSFENDPQKSSSTDINKHTASGYSLFSHCLFDKTKNRFDYYRGENCMKNFSLDLRDHVTEIIDYEQKEIIPLTKGERKLYRKL